MSDVKELTPEFYYLPEFLENVNHVDFGRRQGGDKARIGAVELPPWAHGCARLFVRTMRQARCCRRPPPPPSSSLFLLP